MGQHDYRLALARMLHAMPAASALTDRAYTSQASGEA
jgi:hypothetical protein